MEFVARGKRIILSSGRNTKKTMFDPFYLTKGRLVLRRGQIRGKSSKLLKRLNTFPRIPNSNSLNCLQENITNHG